MLIPNSLAGVLLVFITNPLGPRTSTFWLSCCCPMLWHFYVEVEVEAAPSVGINGECCPIAEKQSLVLFDSVFFYHNYFFLHLLAGNFFKFFLFCYFDFASFLALCTDLITVAYSASRSSHPQFWNLSCISSVYFYFYISFDSIRSVCFSSSAAASA